MTYNFDPDKWYDMEHASLDKRLQEGRFDVREFERQRDALDRRYDEMLNRLDGSYQIPK